MEINEFTRRVRSAVKNELGETYRVELREVRKNNGIMMHGLLICSPHDNVIPTIYLDSFWEAYEEGTAFAVIIRKLLEIYREDSPKEKLDLGFFKYFERVRDNICYRLVRQKGNEAILREIPYVEFLDLAVCFFFVYRGGRTDGGSILIKNVHQRGWGIGTVDLMRAAEKNTPRLFPWECRSMEEILEEMTEADAKEAEEGSAKENFLSEVPMRVLTNRRHIQGAACMLYPGLLERLAEKEGRNLFILPSSVHEVILLPEMGGESAAQLQSMIREVNQTQVAPHEVLSDNLYFYDSAEKRVRIIS